MKTSIMFGLFIALGAINLMLVGCGDGMYLNSVDDSGDPDYSDCDSYPGDADYYQAGAECKGFDVEGAAYEDCGGDDHCAECLMNSYAAGASGC